MMGNFWDSVSDNLEKLAYDPDYPLNPGQRQSLLAIARRLPQNGVIVADEVGLGKTRIAVATTRAVLDAGGRVAICIPPGLGYQWQEELQKGKVEGKHEIARSIWQYFGAWNNGKPWFREKIALLSHHLFNFRITHSQDARWKWLLLATLYAINRKEGTGRFPKYFGDFSDQRYNIYETALSITDHVRKSGGVLKRIYDEILDSLSWKNYGEKDVLLYENYEKGGLLREKLEQAIGLGLGSFDLVIIDEAHKNREEESKLSSLLKAIVQKRHCRRMAITATPIEYDTSQWRNILSRIQAENSLPENIISDYMEAVKKVRIYPEDALVRERYVKAAREFESALKPFLLRRDKREEPSILKFKKLAGCADADYRKSSPLRIDVEKQNKGWKMAVCAAEALSLTGACESLPKRLRLTIANGHGLGEMLQLQYVKEEELQPEKNSIKSGGETAGSRDGELRADWWAKVLKKSLSGHAGDIYNHPEIITATQAIEEICDRDEKVLVFGRFNTPLRALAELVNAREMLRRLASGLPWPQSTISHWAAVEAAWKQLYPDRVLDRVELENKLADQYGEVQHKRDQGRKNLLDKLEKGFAEEPDANFEVFYGKFKSEVMENTREDRILELVDRAMREMGGEAYGLSPAAEVRENFKALIKAMLDEDMDRQIQDQEEIDEEVLEESWELVKKRLRNEFERPSGTHARFMFGETAQQTRRFMQLAFNRKSSHLKVLVCQSLTGREGLNLHEACRTIILLHPEWNSAIVEQQIGRIDRLNSLWEKMLNKAEESGMSDTLPKIEIKPVIFQGTYDEQNWNVLKTRWDNWRAQLHGIIIPPQEAEAISQAIIQEINGAAPDFSPD